MFDKSFLRRYYNKECTEQERLEFEDWLKSGPYEHEEEWMRAIWEEAGERHEIILGGEERIFNIIQGRILDRGDQNPVRVRKKILHAPLERSVWQIYSWLRYASVILVVLIPLFIIKLMVGNHKPSNAVEFITKSTHNGQHLSFTLEDGTKITLNANSRLSFPEHFSDSSRVVRLSGEAFFKVAKDSKRPFRVRTGAVSTTALGTSFNINYSDKMHTSEISLFSGLVEVTWENETRDVQEVRLIPGEQLIYNFDDDSFSTGAFDPLETGAWKDGIIYFKEAGIQEIIRKLEVWYDVKITIMDEHLIDDIDWTYTGKFDNQNLENVLTGIGYVKGFCFEINDKNIKLMFGQNSKCL